VKEVRFPAGFRLERLRREHQRKPFRSGQATVDQWLTTKALQHQGRHLSVTKVLADEDNSIAGYYTLAAGQVDFSDLPLEVAKGLPRRVLPVAVVAWLGVEVAWQGQGLGGRLLGQALRDCWEAGETFPFVAIILDCVDDTAKSFYQSWGFAELPGRPYRLFLSAQRLDAMMQQ
jgi:GNAT superfamily N-acetyltransferase